MKIKNLQFVIVVLAVTFGIVISLVLFSNPAYSTSGATTVGTTSLGFELNTVQPYFDTDLPVFIKYLKSGDYLLVIDDPSKVSTVLKQTSTIKPMFRVGVHVLSAVKYFKIADITASLPKLPKGLDLIMYDYEKTSSPEFTLDETKSIAYFDQATAAIQKYNLRTGSHAILIVNPPFGELRQANWDWGLAAKHMGIMNIQMQSKITNPSLYSYLSAIMAQKNAEAPSTTTFVHFSLLRYPAQDNVNAINTVKNIPGINSFLIFYGYHQIQDVIQVFTLLHH